MAAIFDKPAKAAVLNMKSSNGFYGCTKCLQPGISHREHKDGMIKNILCYLNLSRSAAH